MFTWPPLYTELAKALQRFKDRQPELITFLNEIRKTGIPIIRLIDAPKPATAPMLATIDPFTFFACFNRGLKEQNRIEILKILKEKFHLNSEIPTDFAGIPIVDNQQSWFFPYRPNRKPDDVESLWKLAASAIKAEPEELDPQLFDRCLKIHTVGPAKLTMGMFWINPKNYLALDDKNCAYFQKADITTKVTDHASYLTLLRQVREHLGRDYLQISRSAWEGETRSTQYWAGGFRWEAKNKLEEFTSGNFWQIGWKKNDRNPAAKKTWKYFKDIRVGDEFAIKGYGGRNDLKVHYVGQVTDKSNDGIIQLKKLDRPLFHDKGPVGLTGATWFDTLVPIKKRQIIDAIFAGVNLSTSPAAKALSSRNIILYGPPGTGKTYQLRNHYMQMFTERQTILSAEERASALAKDLAWWEVIALALIDAKDNKAPVAVILEHPLVRARLKLSLSKNPRAIIWSSLQTHTKADCPTVKYTSRIEPLLFSKDENSIWSVDASLAMTEIPTLLEKLEDFRNPPPQTEREVRRYEFTTFHQSFSYEDFIEGIKPQVETTEGETLGYAIQDGVFKKIALEAAANPDRDYALFIDEINRGNVASIFGELITLIEEDKRLKAANELRAILPYSREEFGVPANLYLIGTMNTADRSVEALDTALRRRFTFLELRPNRELIPQPADLALDLRRLFDVINGRIEQLLDHDHCIGHAYFMEIKDLSDLQRIFANKIIPLLREYFYGHPAKVGMVLGDRFVSRKANPIPFAPGWGADELDEKEVIQFADVSKLTAEDFESIYGQPGTGV